MDNEKKYDNKCEKWYLLLNDNWFENYRTVIQIIKKNEFKRIKNIKSCGVIIEQRNQLVYPKWIGFVCFLIWKSKI